MTQSESKKNLLTRLANIFGLTTPFQVSVFSLLMKVSLVIGLTALATLKHSLFMSWFFVGALISSAHSIALIKKISFFQSKKWSKSLAIRLFSGFFLRLFLAILLLYGLIFFYNADILALLCGFSVALWCLIYHTLRQR